MTISAEWFAENLDPPFGRGTRRETGTWAASLGVAVAFGSSPEAEETSAREGGTSCESAASASATPTPINSGRDIMVVGGAKGC